MGGVEHGGGGGGGHQLTVGYGGGGGHVTCFTLGGHGRAVLHRGLGGPVWAVLQAGERVVVKYLSIELTSLAGIALLLTLLVWGGLLGGGVDPCVLLVC